MIEVHTDGGSRSNPGPAGIGAIARDGDTVVFTLSEFLGVQTNNWAEYQGVVRALETLKERALTQEEISFKLDSNLVVEQLNGNWRVKDPGLQEQYKKAIDLIESFDDVSFTHVRREFNKDADKLANEAMDNAQ